MNVTINFCAYFRGDLHCYLVDYKEFSENCFAKVVDGYSCLEITTVLHSFVFDDIKVCVVSYFVFIDI